MSPNWNKKLGQSKSILFLSPSSSPSTLSPLSSTLSLLSSTLFGSSSSTALSLKFCPSINVNNPMYILNHSNQFHQLALGSIYLLIFLLMLIQLLFIQGLSAVRVVALNVPSQVRKGSEVELSCLYDLDNASLYSLKWFYRINDTDLDEQEFFRFTPTLKPYKQFFPLDGINVNVNKSEGGRVVITETNRKTSGNYKCEISVEGTFQTVAAEKLMTVLTGNGACKTIMPSSINIVSIVQLICLLIPSMLCSTFFHDFNLVI